MLFVHNSSLLRMQCCCFLLLQDHVVFSDLSLQNRQNYTVSVRATNVGDISSEEVAASMYVNVDTPQLSGIVWLLY